MEVIAAPYGVGQYGTGLYSHEPSVSAGAGGGSRSVCVDCEPVEIEIPEVIDEVLVSKAPTVENPQQLKRSVRTPRASAPRPVVQEAFITGFIADASTLTYALRHPSPRNNPGVFYPLLLILLGILIWMEHKRTRPVLAYVFLVMPFTRRLGEWLLTTPKNYLKPPTVR